MCAPRWGYFTLLSFNNGYRSHKSTRRWIIDAVWIGVLFLYSCANASQVWCRITPPAVSPPFRLQCALPLCDAGQLEQGPEWGCPCGNMFQWCSTPTRKVIDIIWRVPKTANACIRNHTIIPATTTKKKSYLQFYKKQKTKTKRHHSTVRLNQFQKTQFAQKRSTAAVQIFTCWSLVLDFYRRCWGISTWNTTNLRQETIRHV